MKLHNLVNSLKNNNDNTIEFGVGNKRQRKTFHELYMDAISLLNYLKNRNIKKGERVGILADNSYEWVVLDVACLAAGYILVCFHTDSFKKDLMQVYAKLDVKIVFVNDNIKAKLPTEEIVVGMSTVHEVLSNRPDDVNTNLNILEKNDPFTIIFTSGTTAFPKAIELKVKSFDDFIQNVHSMFLFNNQDKVIIFLPLSHFGQRSYIYLAVLLRFNVVMTSPENIAQTLRISRPTILIGVPYFFENIHRIFYNTMFSSPVRRLAYKTFSYFNKFLPGFLRRQIQARLFKEFHAFWGDRIRILATGSAPINRSTLKFFYNSGIRLYEAYGTNETGLIGLNYPKAYRIGSVGKPFPNKEVRIDESGQILVRGEYCWANRYLYCADVKDNEKFMSDGYIATGDIGYLDKNGFLYIKGRLGELIVLSNGKKIHPNLVETKINNSNLIKQTAVFGHGKSFITAVIVKAEKEVTELQIATEIKRINTHLPNYARIINYITTDQEFNQGNGLLNSNLKLNRRLIYERFIDRLEAFY